MNGQPLAHLIWIVPLALLAIYVGSPRFLGTVAPSRVRRILDAALEKRRYTVIHDLTLPGGGGTVHFDHIIVSQFGIHVIDSLHRPGRIAGTEVQARWRRKFLGRWYTFDNPVHANFLRVQALERLLQLPPSCFHPLVVFSGHKGFKTPMPNKVVSMKKLIPAIRGENRQLLAPEAADQAVLKIQSSVLKPAFLGRISRWKLLRMFLFLTLFTGIYFVYGNWLRAVALDLQHQANVRMAPEKYHPNGKPKTRTELWEDSLICAYSEDTGRCACYEPGGAKARIKPDRCRALAQRGSILER